MLLDDLKFWPPQAVAALREVWITTAEQVVAAGSVEGGVATIVEQTGVREEEIQSLLERTKSCLAPESAERMGKPADTSEMFLGALNPKGEDPDRS